MSREKFMKEVAPVIVRVATEKGYKYPSAVIAQAICESNWGDSKLSSAYFNFFGMKCGSSWKGKYTDMRTKEEYKKGTLTNISAKFRAYDSIEEGIRGYFDFISTKRYANLKKATSAQNYIEMLKADGYATSSVYVDTVYKIWKVNDLGRYDKKKTGAETDSLEQAFETIARHVVAGEFGNGEARKNAIYNRVQKAVEKVLKNERTFSKWYTETE